jgi:hypothetical protein
MKFTLVIRAACVHTASVLFACEERILMLCNANVPGVATAAETVTEDVEVAVVEEAAVASATLTRKAT